MTPKFIQLCLRRCHTFNELESLVESMTTPAPANLYVTHGRCQPARWCSHGWRPAQQGDSSRQWPTHHPPSSGRYWHSRRLLNSQVQRGRVATEGASESESPATRAVRCRQLASSLGRAVLHCSLCTTAGRRGGAGPSASHFEVWNSFRFTP